MRERFLIKTEVMKKIALLVILVFSLHIVFAQDEESTGGLRKENFFGGGSFGLSFGSYTLINISPQVGYRFNKYFASGLGLNMVYASQKEKDIYGADFSKTSQWIMGMNMFARFYPVQKLFLQIQPEANYVWGDIKYYQPTETKYKLDAQIIPSFLAGGGLVTPGERSAFSITVMYDLLQRPHSPYGNQPIIYFGYNFGF